MKPRDIKVGAIYKNRGKGRTLRKVIAIGDEYKPEIYWNATGENHRKNDIGVLYQQDDRKRKLYLSSFAAWCGEEVNL